MPAVGQGSEAVHGTQPVVTGAVWTSENPWAAEEECGWDTTGRGEAV